MHAWTKDSWKNYPIKQQPLYPNEEELNKVLSKLEKLPPLVFAKEIKSLENDLVKVSRKEAFLLQGGDCAESFENFEANNVRDMFKILLQMAIVITFKAQCPVVKIARIAGQFAKPRSSDFEQINGVTLPSYRGDIINSFAFNEQARIPDPNRMLKAYYQSATTLNLLRAFAKGGLADLHEVQRWNLDFLTRNKLYEQYSAISEKISEFLAFMQACGMNTNELTSLKEVSIYTSHEALLLPYEEALTRVDSLSATLYDCSAHMLWIGERTRAINEAHVHFLKGVKNPLGIKIGPNAKLEEILALAKILNPSNEEGRLNLIFRMGAQNITRTLPPIFSKLKSEGLNFIYSIDPMHGNTVKLKNFKTREFDSITQELRFFFQIAKSEGIYPGGVHLEMTGQDVTECTGSNVKRQNLKQRYETQCDPRLNAHQALELAFLIADLVKKARE